jgi:hypothetical protein
MSRRLVGFLIMIGLGLGLGLLYGWVINPVQYKDTTPDTLRADFKTDYVLMVAEVYRAKPDLSRAASSLAVLGSQAPAQLASQAALDARRGGYSKADLDALDALSKAFQVWTPVPRLEKTP